MDPTRHEKKHPELWSMIRKICDESGKSKDEGRHVLKILVDEWIVTPNAILNASRTDITGLPSGVLLRLQSMLRKPYPESRYGDSTDPHRFPDRITSRRYEPSSHSTSSHSSDESSSCHSRSSDESYKKTHRRGDNKSSPPSSRRSDASHGRSNRRYETPPRSRRPAQSPARSSRRSGEHARASYPPFNAAGSSRAPGQDGGLNNGGRGRSRRSDDVVHSNYRGEQSRRSDDVHSNYRGEQSRRSDDVVHSNYRGEQSKRSDDVHSNYRGEQSRLDTKTQKENAQLPQRVNGEESTSQDNFNDRETKTANDDRFSPGAKMTDRKDLLNHRKDGNVPPGKNAAADLGWDTSLCEVVDDVGGGGLGMNEVDWDDRLYDRWVSQTLGQGWQGSDVTNNTRRITTVLRESEDTNNIRGITTTVPNNISTTITVPRETCGNARHDNVAGVKCFDRNQLPTPSESGDGQVSSLESGEIRSSYLGSPPSSAREMATEEKQNGWSVGRGRGRGILRQSGRKAVSQLNCLGCGELFDTSDACPRCHPDGQVDDGVTIEL